jgi:ureidoglycolate lyase
MLITKPISSAGLAPLATTLASSGKRRTDFPEAMEPGPGAGRHSLAVIHFEAVTPEKLVIDKLERHPYSAQTFIPISVGRYYVVVAPSKADGSPDADRARSFVGGPGDTIVYPKNAWHGSLLVLDQAADMAVIMWRRQAGDDTVIVDLATPIAISA